MDDKYYGSHKNSPMIPARPVSTNLLMGPNMSRSFIVWLALKQVAAFTMVSTLGR